MPSTRRDHGSTALPRGRLGSSFSLMEIPSLVADIAARPEAEADARLIAAAPEMADVLEAI